MFKKAGKTLLGLAVAASVMQAHAAETKKVDVLLVGGGIGGMAAALALARLGVSIDLLEQSTDVAIRIGELADSSLHARSLGCSPVQVLASPAYLEQHGTPRQVEELANHCLLGFSQPESLNHWPLRHAQGDRWSIRPALVASSGETLRQLALAGEGIVSLSHFMTHEDIRTGRLQAVSYTHLTLPTILLV